MKELLKTQKEPFETAVEKKLAYLTSSEVFENAEEVAINFFPDKVISNVTPQKADNSDVISEGKPMSAIQKIAMLRRAMSSASAVMEHKLSKLKSNS